ncbi:MAG: DUF192 domain-containing protein [Acidobacteriota bacterium]|nr:DUF192 domain-containing protein [Acidobacteriota bacterium]
MANLRVWNRTRNILLAERALAAGTSKERRTGLLAHTGLDENGGLWIAPCEAVHTIGMKFPIDVLFLDKKRKVLKIRKDMQRWRMAACLRAHSVLELAAGRAEATGTAVGDELELQKYDG